MDVVDRVTRSRMMSGIRGKDTKPERFVRSALHRAGLRFGLHAKLPGKPDVVLPKYHAVVFVHGCFWHQHRGCRYATTPATNADFWKEKFAANKQRDAAVKRKLRRLGWKVSIVWSCQLNQRKMNALIAQIRSGKDEEA
ncbi:MAG: very short patch repair endonuclease [Bryobacterales bacterium]|nr:very short patch repair endonuclease [Bryobacterales bacterium]